MCLFHRAILALTQLNSIDTDCKYLSRDDIVWQRGNYYSSEDRDSICENRIPQAYAYAVSP